MHRLRYVLLVLALAHTPIVRAQSLVAFYGTVRDPSGTLIEEGIFTVPSSGGAVAPLALSNGNSLSIQSGNAYPQWSADGRTVLFKGADRTASGVDTLFTIDGLRGGTPQAITAATGLSVRNAPAWMPDGRRVAFTGFDAAAPAAAYDIYTLASSGGPAIPVSNLASTSGELMVSPSPDGAWIAYLASGASTAPGFDLYVVAVPSGAVPGPMPQLIDTGLVGGRPSWSPDGRLAYASWSDSSGTSSDVYMTGPSLGLPSTSLTGGAYPDAQGATFSPDGQTIAFVNSGALLLIPAVGGTATPIATDATGWTEHPLGLGWSPDGTRIVYPYRAGGNVGVAVVDRSGAQTFLTPADYDRVHSPSFEPPVASAYVTGQVQPGGWLSSSATASTGLPVATTVTSPQGGQLTIQTTPGATSNGDWILSTTQVQITAPPATPDQPLIFAFDLLPATLPLGADLNSVQVFRNGVLVPDGCVVSSFASASDYPCVLERHAAGNGDFVLTVRTIAASTWAFGLHRPYPFEGFYAPVGNPPTLNVVNAGRAIPLKFSLGGFRSLAVLAADSPASERIACDSSAPIGVPEETTSAGANTLAHDAGSGQYKYVWKTDPSWSGSCRQFLLRTNDGLTRRANFRFR